MRRVISVFAAVVLAQLLYTAICAPIDDDFGTFKKALNAIDKVLAFLAEDYSHVNLDGVYGLRIGQGQLEAAVKELSSHGKNRALTERVKAMDSLAQTIAEEARGYIEADDQDYYNRFVSLIDAPYMIRYTPVELMFQKDNNTFNELKEGDHYNEEEGDACLARLMGSFLDENQHPVARCTVTQACWDAMSEPGGYRYKITHQILYFIVGQKQNCDDALEQYAQGERVHDIETRMCQSVYAEANSFVENGSISIVSRDLFLEQITLCGILGYEDFLKNDWILTMLEWQQANGCFTIPGLEGALPTILAASNSTTTTTTTPRPQRSLLRDSFMKDCGPRTTLKLSSSFTMATTIKPLPLMSLSASTLPPPPPPSSSSSSSSSSSELSSELLSSEPPTSFITWTQIIIIIATILGITISIVTILKYWNTLVNTIRSRCTQTQTNERSTEPNSPNSSDTDTEYNKFTLFSKRVATTDFTMDINPPVDSVFTMADIENEENCKAAYEPVHIVSNSGSTSDRLTRQPIHSTPSMHTRSKGKVHTRSKSNKQKKAM